MRRQTYRLYHEQPILSIYLWYVFPIKYLIILSYSFLFNLISENIALYLELPSSNNLFTLLIDTNMPLKLYSIYAPPHHPIGTIHKTKFDSDLADD